MFLGFLEKKEGPAHTGRTTMNAIVTPCFGETWGGGKHAPPLGKLDFLHLLWYNSLVRYLLFRRIENSIYSCGVTHEKISIKCCA